jgi:hypothetical protein
MTEQQKQTIIMLRDEMMYYQRRTQETHERLQLLMLQLGMNELKIDVIEEQKSNTTS